MKAYYLQDGYSGKGRGLTGWYRPLTVQEAKAGKFRSTLYFTDRNNKVREMRVNGNCKEWKTFPGIEIPVKYGLRECARFGGRDLLPGDFVDEIMCLVPVKFPFDKDTPDGIVADYVMDHEMGIHGRS